MANKKIEVDVLINSDDSLKKLKELQKALRQLPAGTAEWKKVYGEIDDLKDRLDGAKAGTDDWIDSLQNAGGPLGLVGRGLNSVKVAFTSFNTALKASVIGLIAAALGGLVAAFTQNESAMKKLQPIFIALQRILGGIFRALEPLLDAFVDMAMTVLPYVTKGIGIFYSALVALFTYIKEAGTGVFKFWKGLLTLDFDTVKEGVEQIGGSFQKTAEAYGATMKRFEAGTKEQTKIEKEEADKRTKNAKDAQDERDRLAKEALDKKKKNLDAEIQLEINKENTSKEKLKKLLDDRFQAELQGQKLSQAEKELLRQEYAKKLEDALAEDEKKRQEDEKKRLEKLSAELDAKIQLEIEKENTSREQLKQLLEQRMAIELNNAELSEAQKEVIRQKYAKQLEDSIKADSEKRKADLLKAADEALAAAQGDYAKQLNAFQEYSVKILNSTDLSEKERADKIKSYRDAILQTIINSYAAETAALDQKYGEFRRFDKNYYDELIASNQAAQDKLNAAKAAGAITDVEYTKQSAELGKARIEIGQKEAASRVEVTARIGDAFGQLSELVGKDTLAGKAFAIAKATIDTYQSAVAAYKSLAGIPVVGPVLGAIAAAAAVATGIATVKKIVAVQVPQTPASSKISTAGGSAAAPSGPITVNASRAQGGLISGAGSSTSDSILARLSNGEFVMNARSTSMFRPLLESMNSVGNQPQFAVGGLLATSPTYNSNISNMGTESLTEVMSRPIKTYVVATDMTTQQQFERTIKSRSTI